MAKKKQVRPMIADSVIIGRNPDTGIITRLTIEGETLTIERQPYYSKHKDGWNKHYEPLVCLVENHLHLIDKITNNPAIWPDN